MTPCRAPRRWLLAACLLAGGVQAQVCQVGTLPAPPPPVAAAVWRDAAEFAFLVGQDLATDRDAMTLVRRLRTQPVFGALRLQARGWPVLQQDLHAAADAVAGLAAQAPALAALCAALADETLDPARPFDAPTWAAQVGDVAGRIDAALALAEPVLPPLRTYADQLTAVAVAPAQAGLLPPDAVRTGPAPQAVAEGLGALAAQWRTVLADLRQARALLPASPERGTERPLVAMTSALHLLARTAAQARTMASERLSPEQAARYAGGDYLDAACPAFVSGRAVALENRWWSARVGGAALLRVGQTLPPALHINGSTPPPLQRMIVAMPLSPTPSPEQLGVWRVHKAGPGYWRIVLASGDAAAPQIVLAARGEQAPVVVAPRSTEVVASAELWRCAAGDRPDEVRLYTLASTERFVLDTRPDRTQVAMGPAGQGPRQSWALLPR
ncbi:hypothetical protein ACPOLB_08955 [Rubrivivax sp. RP6-9]|uniref:hypothetical protein n=1 Tax=Rubrivivax sp. RP6-9 TaxID=3415750 RepID=UPI003CC53407